MLRNQQIYFTSLYPLEGKDRGLSPQREWRGHEERQTIGLLYGRCSWTETQASQNDQRQDCWPDCDIEELRRLCQCDEDQSQFFHLGTGLEVQVPRPFWEWASSTDDFSFHLCNIIWRVVMFDILLIKDIWLETFLGWIPHPWGWTLRMPKWRSWHRSVLLFAWPIQ